MAKRKPVSKKVRFEVFKRDSFTCQYCGAKAPDATLQVDHILPVAEGGKNDILNLVTSCSDCNQGKGARLLSDDAAVKAQINQLEELNERREQIEMMVSWRESLQDINLLALEAIQHAIERKSQFSTTKYATKSIEKWLRKFDLQELLEAVDISFDQYLEFDAEGSATDQSWDKAFDYVPRIASVRQRSKDNPEMPRFLYIRGILRNRLNGVPERESLKLIETACHLGAPIEGLIDLARDTPSWEEFADSLHRFISDEGEGE